jgi:uncharacterized protein (DUF2252 family)
VSLRPPSREQHRRGTLSPAVRAANGRHDLASGARDPIRLLPGADPYAPRVGRLAIPSRRATQQWALGHERRKVVPRAAFGDWVPAADRPDPTSVIEQQNRSRVAELVPIRHSRLLVSPFKFFRGAAAVMAADLARMPSAGIYVQASGDAHLSNFGAFATPEHRLAFDLNDFDETHPAPFEWDLLRLAASIAVAARSLGLPGGAEARLARDAVGAYRARMLTLADEPFLDVWYAKVDLSEVSPGLQRHDTGTERRRAARWMRRVGERTNGSMLTQLATRTSRGWRLRDDPPLLVRRTVGERSRMVVRQAMAAYGRSLGRSFGPIFEQYRFADVARYVSGVASVGRSCFVMLFVGAHDGDAVFLQLKEAPVSVLAPYTEPAAYAGQGERVVMGQRLMQAATDPLLGWLSVDGLERPLDFYVRQLRDWKASFELEASSEKRLARYVRLCGHTLAQAHARSGTASTIAGYLGRAPAMDRAVARFASLYADQNERDYAAFQQAARDGRIGVSATP